MIFVKSEKLKKAKNTSLSKKQKRDPPPTILLQKPKDQKYLISSPHRKPKVKMIIPSNTYSKDLFPTTKTPHHFKKFQKSKKFHKNNIITYEIPLHPKRPQLPPSTNPSTPIFKR